MKLRPARKPKKQKSPTGEMELVEHLKELRTRVVYALIALIFGTVVGFIWYQSAPPGMQSLGEILRGPYCSLPAENRVALSNDGECRLLATRPTEMFMLRLKVGALAGAVISSPVWLYQLWAFITPGLHKQERRWTVTFVTLAVSLFVAGAILAYYVIAVGLGFLITIGDETQTAALTGGDYFHFLLAFLVIFGVCFEVPLIIAMLNIVGLLGYNQMKGKRRIIWVATFIFAAVLSPGGDPFSMLILGIAVGVLIELSLQFCRWNDKRRGIDSEEFAELDDDEASDLVYRPDPVRPAEPVQPVAPARSSTAAVPDQPASSVVPTNGSYFDDVL